MKICFFGALLVLLVAPAFSLAAEPVTQPIRLGGNHTGDFVIVLAAKPLPANRRAADELVSYIKQITGDITLKVQDDTQPLPQFAILVGPSKALDALGVKLDADKLGADGFVEKSIAGPAGGFRIVLAGPGPRGSMYAAYDFLEKIGVRWFTPKVTRVPHTPGLALTAVYDETQVPPFEIREPYFTEAFDKDWAARNRIVGNSPHLDDSTGGTIRYADSCHTFERLIPPTLFATHPEYFPLINGKRTGGYVQRCLSNPDVLKLAIGGVKKAFADNPGAAITSVSQNDTDKWCECDQCKALYAKYGGQSGAYLWFANQVAEAIEKDPSLSGKLIHTFAYQFTEAPPTGIAPRKNVRVQLCPIACCQAHPYEICTDKDTKAFLTNLAGWAKLTGGEHGALWIWHYATNFSHYPMPYPDFTEFPAEFKLYRRSGVSGVFIEGAYGGTGGGADAELRSWVMAKLLWNPDAAKVDDLVTEWMRGVYGEKAAVPLKAWFDLVQSKATDPAVRLRCYGPLHQPWCADDVLAAGEKLFDQAAAAVAADPTANSLSADYVAKGRLSLRYMKLDRHPEKYAGDLDAFVADSHRLGASQISERQSLDQWAADYRAKHPPKK